MIAYLRTKIFVLLMFCIFAVIFSVIVLSGKTSNSSIIVMIGLLAVAYIVGKP
jgi:uncharacterized membrane protein